MESLLQIFIGVILLIISIPAGLLLAHFTQDELKQGRKWFKLIMLTSIIFGIILLLANISTEYKLASTFTIAFIFVVAFISHQHSLNYNKDL